MAKRTAGRNPNGMGSIYKDGQGYRIAVLVGYDASTGKPKYRKVRCSTHEEAVTELKRMTREQIAGRLEMAAGMTLDAYLKHWLEFKIKPLRAPATYRQYCWLVSSHIEPHLGKKRLDKIGRPDVQRLIAAKHGQKVSARDKEGKNLPDATLSRNTLRLIRAILQSAYSDAIKDGLASKNPAEYIDLPQVPKKAPAFLNPDEAAKLMEELADSELATLFAFMLFTGTRIGEATGIRWQDLELEQGIAHVRGQLQRVEGKLVYRQTTKTNQDRHLPIPRSLSDQLKSLRAERMLGGVTDPDGIVFLNAEHRRLDPKYVATRLKGLCKSAGVPEVSPHKLRHTSATLALAATGDLHAVQKLLGHQQQSLTSDLYGHATAKTLRPLSDALAKALGNGSDQVNPA